jgi:hypothetical protein
MNFAELCLRTKELASNGADWNRVLFDDAVHEAYCELSQTEEFDKEKLEAAFVEGRREHRISKGWIVCWTNAQADYDQFDTEELECFEWHHRPLRKVLMNPGNAVYQRSRYMSGASVWDEDPREIERRIQETIAKDKAEAAEKHRVREEGLSWLRSADLSKRTDEDLFDNEVRSRGLTWTDLRVEQKRRDEEQETAKRVAIWNECRAMFADGCTIVDPGRDSIKGTNPYTDPSIPASDAAVYRNVRVVPHWSAKNDAHEARVEDERHEFVGSLWRVAQYLKKGLLRIATDDEKLPPNAVLDRLKPSRLDHVFRFEAEGRVVWVGRERFSYWECIVLDEHGKLVRKKSIKEAAEKAFREKRNPS